MNRIEDLDSWFFPSPTKIGGLIVPAPDEAVRKYEDLKTRWQKDHPELPHEIPRVSLHPGKQDNQEGYLVKIQIMYR